MEDDLRTRQERAARSQSLFREVNERVEELNRGFDTLFVTFLCECCLADCSASVSLTIEEYESVRAVPTRFVVSPGHVIEAVERLASSGGGRYQVVEMVEHAARVAVELDPRPGRVPAARQEPARAEEDPGAVLLVEDEPAIRLVCRINLEAAGFRVLEASDANHALALLNREAVKVAVLDISLSGGREGITLARQIRDAWPAVAIVIMSGTVPPDAEAESLADATMAKPFELDDLLATVTRLAGSLGP